MISKIVSWFTANKYDLKVALVVGLIWPIAIPWIGTVLNIVISIIIGFGTLYWVGTILEVNNQLSIFRSFVYSTVATLFIYTVGSGVQLLFCLNRLTRNMYCSKGYSWEFGSTSLLFIGSMLFITIGTFLLLFATFSQNE